MVGYAAELVIGPATSGRTRWRLTTLYFANLGRRVRRENDVARSLLPARGEKEQIVPEREKTRGIAVLTNYFVKSRRKAMELLRLIGVDIMCVNHIGLQTVSS
jgi:hypothetical protein